MAVTDTAIQKIKEMIVSGALAPGDRLPPEKELSESLGLSRSSLREAVKALEVIRVLDVRRGDGTYVTSLAPRELLEAMSFVVDLHDRDVILEIFGVRRILESSASGLAAQHATDADRAALHELLDSVDVDGEITSLVEHDLAFHSRIAASTGNGYLAGLLDSMSSQTVRARIWRGITEENAVDRTLREHRAILAAIDAGDAALAEALTVSHVAGIESWLRNAG
ncbi:FadR/GntR family transcriptional regulator [Agromyces atrinae]|uniref:FadR family transcriptional regulator n=1 Tax=Agromyces atrinae TaxID=592376 RepID=A0A4Q2M848_9MICO|nr:FadR/GntR family transcriptional regulator [Agromyces atrinae]NYD68685.1 GntR family transcriptional repressor for pyruvate dehydrogenase complex [Agromyces atrinae]RXZ86052.1 FadR family transcriptional regulator [Agromyces atrinae]